MSLYQKVKQFGKKEYNDYISNLQKTNTVSAIQIKKLFNKEKTLDDITIRIDKELGKEDIKSGESQTLRELKYRIVQKRDAIKDYINVIGYQ